MKRRRDIHYLITEPSLIAIYSKQKQGPAAAAEKLDIESLTPTDLKLKLLGTVTGDEKEAYAVIEDTAVRRQNLYKIGDTIQNATLKMILREKVVLQCQRQR